MRKVHTFIKNEFKNAAPVVTEERIAKRFRVSRTPVREVLKRLEQDGVIVSRKRTGIALRRMSRRQWREINDVRSALERLAVTSALPRIREQDLRRLELYADRFVENARSGNYAKYVRADKLFHGTIVRLSGNRYLQKMLRQMDLMEVALNTGALSMKCGDIAVLMRRDRNPYPHQEIVRILRGGDAEKAEKAIGEHIRYSEVLCK